MRMLLTAVLATTVCEPFEPGFCVEQAATESCAGEETGCLITADSIDDFDGIHVSVTLPQRVHTDEPLEITATTPCDSETTKIPFGPSHESGHGDVAETTIEAPVGAGCRLSVTLDVANFHEVCRTAVDACPDLQATCDESGGIDAMDSGSSGGP